jgi:acetyl esterase/lipase
MIRSRAIWHRTLATSSLGVAFLGAVAAPPASAQATREEPAPKAKAAPTQPPIPPTFGNVAYGDHPRQVLDFCKADTPGPAPLVIFIHGGGWTNGDKYGLGAGMVKGHHVAIVSIDGLPIHQTYFYGRPRIPDPWGGGGDAPGR